MTPTRPTLWPLHVSRPVPHRIAKRLGLAVDDLSVATVAMSPRIDDLWLEAPLDDGWTVAYRLAVGPAARPVVSELRVFPAETLPGRAPGEWSGIWRGIRADVPRHGLTRQILSRVRVHRHLAELPAILRYLGTRGVPQEQLGRFGLRLTKRPTSGRGRKPLPDEFLAQVASDYVAALDASSRHPLQDVAASHKTPIVVVRGWVYKARQRGLLVGGAWGKAAGRLSPAAVTLLRRSTQQKARRRSARRSSQGKGKKS